MIYIKCDVMLTERELESTWKPARRVSATSTYKEKKSNISQKGLASRQEPITSSL